jgi:hypothetical protein
MSLFPSKFHRDLVLTQLRTLGVVNVEISFSGGGDSGSIDAARCCDANNKVIDLPDTKFDWPRERTTFDTNLTTGHPWKRETYVEKLTLAQILEALTNDALEEQNLDWYNNDGGQGSLTIDFTQSPPDIQLNVGINITTTEDHEFNFSDEEYEEEDTQ